jgi:hypothetical protein
MELLKRGIAFRKRVMPFLFLKGKWAKKYGTDPLHI